jgi:hypothetical protein
MTSTPGAVRRYTRISGHEKASEKTPIKVIPPVLVKYGRTPPPLSFTPFIHLFDISVAAAAVNVKIYIII